MLSCACLLPAYASLVIATDSTKQMGGLCHAWGCSPKPDRAEKHSLCALQAAPVVWDGALAASAARWAAGCPTSHSGYQGVGENMAWGFVSLTAAVGAWYAEVRTLLCGPPLVP